VSPTDAAGRAASLVGKTLVERYRPTWLNLVPTIVAYLLNAPDATPAQRAALRGAVAPHQTRITQWLDSFGQGLMPQEAATFMYMQLAIEEMVERP